MMQGWAAQTPTQEKDHEWNTTREFSANWYAAYTLSHHEKRVASLLTGRRIESFLPLYAALHRWRNGCTKNLDLPLFPNYVFVRIDSRERARVLAVPGVVSLIGSGRTLSALPDLEIEALRCGISVRAVEPHPYLVVGDRVRIKAGAMSGLEGLLVRKKNGFRVVLALDAIMHSVAVEVGAEDLEPAPKSLCGQAARFSPGETSRPRLI